MQSVEPWTFWYVPAGHAVHSWLRVAAAYVPLLQAVAEVAPAKQKWPDGHSSHSFESPRPVALLYEPPGHGSAAEAPSVQ